MSAIVRLLALLLGLAIQTYGLAAVPPDFVVVDGAQRLHSRMRGLSPESNRNRLGRLLRRCTGG